MIKSSVYNKALTPILFQPLPSSAKNYTNYAGSTNPKYYMACAFLQPTATPTIMAVLFVTTTGSNGLYGMFQRIKVRCKDAAKIDLYNTSIISDSTGVVNYGVINKETPKVIGPANAARMAVESQSSGASTISLPTDLLGHTLDGGFCPANGEIIFDFEPALMGNSRNTQTGQNDLGTISVAITPDVASNNPVYVTGEWFINA